MVVLICGGRSYAFTDADTRWLDDLHAQHPFTEVVTGGAGGAETSGLLWARRHDIAIRVFCANWEGHGTAAGSRRNARMLQYLVDKQAMGASIAVIAFPGGRGTADCMRQARHLGVQVWRPMTQQRPPHHA